METGCRILARSTNPAFGTIQTFFNTKGLCIAWGWKNINEKLNEIYKPETTIRIQNKITIQYKFRINENEKNRICQVK